MTCLKGRSTLFPPDKATGVYYVVHIETWENRNEWQNLSVWRLGRSWVHNLEGEVERVTVWCISSLGCYLIADRSQSPSTRSALCPQGASISAQLPSSSSMRAECRHTAGERILCRTPCTQVFFHCQSSLLHFSFLSCIFSDWRGVMREDLTNLSPIRDMRQKEISWNWALKRLNGACLTLLHKGLVWFLAAQCPVIILFFFI